MRIDLRRIRSAMLTIMMSGSLFLAAGRAEATPTIVGIDAFTTAATVVDFEGLSNNQAITDQYASVGVTFSGGLYGNGVGKARNRLQGSPTPGNTVTIDFSQQMIRAGFDVTTNDVDNLDVEVLAYSSGVLVTTGTFNFDTSQTAIFVGIQDLAGIDRLVLQAVPESGPGSSIFTFTMDNLRFEDDDGTPAFETVCDPLKKNATPGLYGLCVAYCEAQDCNDDPVGFAECQAENAGDPWGTHSCSCGRVLDNYNRKRTPEDPEMPCVEPACPCFDAEFLATQISRITFCDEIVRPDRDQWITNGRDADLCLASAQGTAFSSGNNTCTAFNADRNSATGRCEMTLNTVQSGLTEAEVQACQDLIRDHCTAP